MSAQPVEPVWNIRHELSAGVLEGGPVTLTALQARTLLARVDELQAIRARAVEVRDSWRNGHQPEISPDQEAVAYYILGKDT